MEKNITAETVNTKDAAATAPEDISQPSSSPATQFHCPFQQAALLQQALLPDKMRVAFFLGAGCPTAIRVPDGSGTKPLIPDISGLTLHISTAFNAIDDVALKTGFGTVISHVKEGGKPDPNIEDILSHIRLLQDVVGAREIDGLSGEVLSRLDKEICRFPFSPRHYPVSSFHVITDQTILIWQT